MQKKLAQLKEALKLCPSKFNQKNSHKVSSIESFIQKIDKLSISLSQRIEYSNQYYNLLKEVDLRALSIREGEIGKDQKVDFGHLKVTIDGHKACIQAINTAVDGIYFNISSALDIFAMIAIALIYKYPEKGYLNFNKLSDYCNESNPSSKFERLVREMFVKYDKSNPDKQGIINDIRKFRNNITHAKVFYPGIVKVVWEPNEPLGPHIPYLKIDSNVFPSLPMIPNGNFVDYTQAAMLKVGEFLEDAVQELTLLVGNAPQIPAH